MYLLGTRSWEAPRSVFLKMDLEYIPQIDNIGDFGCKMKKKYIFLSKCFDIWKLFCIFAAFFKRINNYGRAKTEIRSAIFRRSRRFS